MRIATCQLHEVLGDMDRAVSVLRTQALAAADGGAELVCFPEGFLQGYELRAGHVTHAALDLDSAAFRVLLRQFASIDPVIVVGLIERSGDHHFNTAVAIRRGAVLTRYRKTDLLPAEKDMFTAGDGPVVFDVSGVRIGLAICHDLTSPDFARRMAHQQAQVLVCPCNNMLPREVAEQWKDRHGVLRSERAREHGLWVVTSEVTGERDGWIACAPTAIIDSKGSVVAQVPKLEEGRVWADVTVPLPLPS